MATLHFELVSPEQLLFSGNVDQVDVPGAEGDFGVLAGHAPYVATLKPGILTVRTGTESRRIVVLGGFAEVGANGLTILADLASDVADFDRAELKSRIEDMESKAKDAEGSELDRIIERLDHFKSVDHHLEGTAMH